MRNDIIAIICPDIHGRDFWKKVADEYDGTVPFVFLGDYLDPYSEEGITPEDAKNNFEELWKFAEKWDSSVKMLLGNHDLSYYDKAFKCCRYAYSNGLWYPFFLNDHWKKFNFAYEIKNDNKTFLMTHAGVHPEWLEQNDFEQNYAADYINHLFQDTKMSFNNIGYYRGGRPWTTGSPIWCDIREFNDFLQSDNKRLAMPRNVTQIVGHTQLTYGKVEFDGITCIDSRQVFVITKDNKIEPYYTEKASE
jgi:hypothetical protein